jgi:hypothetical protein
MGLLHDAFFTFVPSAVYSFGINYAYIISSSLMVTFLSNCIRCDEIREITGFIDQYRVNWKQYVGRMSSDRIRETEKNLKNQQE